MGVGIVVAYLVDYTPIGTRMDNKFQTGDKFKKAIQTRTCKVDPSVSHHRTKGHNAFDFIDSRIIAPLFLTVVIATIPLSIARVAGVDMTVVG